MAIKCYSSKSANQTLEPFSYEPKELGPLDVEIDISYCGVCHSDLHLMAGEMGSDIYPLVPGHEIVGHVSKKGEGVKSLDIGQRVGVGWQSGSCMDCEWCDTGEENLCETREATCRGNYGGFAEAIRLDSRFAFPLPEGMKSEDAGPLLCGGITVYSPLSKYVLPSMKVGVIGIGGLGHMALQFANAMGCEVTAYSTSKDKETEARNLGAHNFIVSKDAKQMKDAEKSLDFILSTVSANIPWSDYLQNLRSNGRLCFVGISSEPMSIPGKLLLSTQRAICGSVVGNRSTIKEMLEFAARNDVKPVIEVMPMSSVNDAIEKVRRNEARYRIVLER
jgi:uncharacterized zinc-type alcohol dehydrogenase-like protein